MTSLWHIGHLSIRLKQFSHIQACLQGSKTWVTRSVRHIAQASSEINAPGVNISYKKKRISITFESMSK